MAFFPRNFYNSDASFTPLFRLLDDFDNYSRQGSRSTIQHWQPKFDVRETGEAYELHGELPGVNKEEVHIEFTEPQVLQIRGQTERTYTAGTPPAGLVEGASTSGTITDGTDHRNSHRATVEDETEEGSKTEADQQVEKSADQKPADASKYWLTERSFGEFSRSFNFPTRVDQDGVNASFKDGILSIVVPKAKKHESRRITVN